ncbi:DUF115 domain-containing protein [Gammaproteobacteria bacterium]|nr:DUF115 domain-containing protein [Gammaproteobacteria bacterium]
MKNMIKKVLGQRLSDSVARNISQFLWEHDPRAKRSREFLLGCKDKYVGQKCIIIGNGPSLNDTDFSLFSELKTFGQNRIYLASDHKDFSPDFLVVVNGLVASQFCDEISALDMPRFMSWANRKYFNKTDDVIYLWDRSGGSEDGFSEDLTTRVYIDSTVTYVSMQLAWWMGFDKVGLVGVDHYFHTKGENDKVVVSQGDDPNHFDPRYFGPGTVWHLPNLDRSEESYYAAKNQYESADRKIYDCTVNGKLKVYEKMSLEKFCEL